VSASASTSIVIAEQRLMSVRSSATQLGLRLSGESRERVPQRAVWPRDHLQTLSAITHIVDRS
jgi:hypothetical protein